MSEIVEAIGELNSELELLIEKNVDNYKITLQAILDGTSERDPDIFANAGAELGMTLQDFEQVPVAERGDRWSIGLSALISASHMQAMSDAGIFIALMKLSEQSGADMNKAASGASNEELVEAVGELPGSGVTERKLAEKRAKNA